MTVPERIKILMIGYLPPPGCHRPSMLMNRATTPVSTDPFAAKRAAMRDEFFDKLFLLGGWLGATDTYKRTMWAAVPDVARHAAATRLAD